MMQSLQLLDYIREKGQGIFKVTKGTFEYVTKGVMIKNFPETRETTDTSFPVFSIDNRNFITRHRASLVLDTFVFYKVQGRQITMELVTLHPTEQLTEYEQVRI